MILGKGSSGLDFDENGPRIGHVRLIRRTTLGYVPRSAEELSKVFAASRDFVVRIGRIETGLASICRAMNNGDFSLAGLLTGRLLTRPLSSKEMGAARHADWLLKAAADDPKHPGYPARTPEGKGGEFRPKDEEDADVTFVDRRTAKLKRLGQRRGFRAALRRVLTWKRLLRLAEKNSIAAGTEEVPVLDAATDAAALAEDISFLEDVASEVKNSESAIKFLQESTGELSDILVTPEKRGFESFDAFKKINIEKVFGPAGDGLDYHHIVEQGPNAAMLTDEMLQSTENIVRIPKLLHEEINSLYATPRLLGGRWVTPRDYLRGSSYNEQREFGLKILREVGILR